MAELSVPDTGRQKSVIAFQLQRPLVKDDTWYIIDAKWFKQWKSYVGYEVVESGNPGPIDNSSILQGDSKSLKERMIEDLDYALIPEQGWQNLVAWYGMIKEQEPLPRKVIEEGLYTKSLTVEVYPWHLNICKTSKPNEQISKQFSRSDTIEQLEKKIREEFNIAEGKEVRLWNRYMFNMYEQLNLKDKTLQDAGLFQGQVMEVEQKNDDGTWQRQTKSGNTFWNSSFNEPGNCSFKPGLCGFSNTGNLCFMNSILQCLSNVPKLTEYFLSDYWAKEVNTDNQSGIVRTYAELIQSVWSGKNSVTEPKNLKCALGSFAPQFTCNKQQDSLEFLAFLLDALHKDLNRVRKKPCLELKDPNYCPAKEIAQEAWGCFKKRNDSVITDLFRGLLKVTVQCPDCENICVTFDPFCYLSLPVSVKVMRLLKLFWVPMDPTKKPVQFKLRVPKMGYVADICDTLSKYVQVERKNMVVADVYYHRFHKVFAMSESISQIMDRDDIFIYEVAENSQDGMDLIILPIYMREERGSPQSYMGTYQLYGQPLLISVPRQKCTYSKLYEIVLKRMSRFVRVPADKENDESKHVGMSSTVECENAIGGVDLKEESGIEKPRFFRFSVLNSYGTAEMNQKLTDDGNPLKLNSHMYISADWSRIDKEKFYCESEAESFDAHATMYSKTEKSCVLQLSDCLDSFTTTEKIGTIDPWYCLKCKKHNEAYKKTNLWSLPEILIIHLSRFSNNYKDKIDALVEFPAKDLGLDKYVISSGRKQNVYNLIGVSNHYGRFEGGHNTAYCKNVGDHAWYYFDDPSVSASSEHATVSKAAYILVYERRSV